MNKNKIFYAFVFVSLLTAGCSNWQICLEKPVIKKTYYPNGKLEWVTRYRCGRLDGVSGVYGEAGNLWLAQAYSNGEELFTEIYNLDGSLGLKEKFTEGKKSLATEFKENSLWDLLPGQKAYDEEGKLKRAPAYEADREWGFSFKTLKFNDSTEVLITYMNGRVSDIELFKGEELKRTMRLRKINLDVHRDPLQDRNYNIWKYCTYSNQSSPFSGLTTPDECTGYYPPRGIESIDTYKNGEVIRTRTFNEGGRLEFEQKWYTTFAM